MSQGHLPPQIAMPPHGVGIYGVWSCFKGATCKLELDIECRDQFSQLGIKYVITPTNYCMIVYKLFYRQAKPRVKPLSFTTTPWLTSSFSRDIFRVYVDVFLRIVQ